MAIQNAYSPTLALDSPRRVAGTVVNAPEPVGRIWPSGAFGFAVMPGGRRQEMTQDDYDRDVATRLGWRGEVPRSVPEDEGGSSIGLSDVSNSHKRTDRGSKGLTGYGAHMVESGIKLMQERYGKGCLGFLTLTPPTLSDSDWHLWARNWTESCRVFLQWLQRKTQSLGLSGRYVYVTEIQSKRSAELYGAPAYHLHIIVHVSTRWYQSLLSPAVVRRAWERAWDGRLNGEYSWKSSEELRYVKKDASAYLAKYMSKGAGSISSIYASGYAFPASWWGMSADMRRWVKTETLTGLDAMTIIEYLTMGHLEGDEWMEPLIAYAGRVQIDVGDGHMLTVGYRGALTARGLAYVRGLLGRK